VFYRPLCDLRARACIPTGARSRSIWQTINEDVQPIERTQNSRQASRPQAFSQPRPAAMTFKIFTHSLHKRTPLTQQM